MNALGTCQTVHLSASWIILKVDIPALSVQGVPLQIIKAIGYYVSSSISLGLTLHHFKASLNMS